MTRRTRKLVTGVALAKKRNKLSAAAKRRADQREADYQATRLHLIQQRKDADR